eukprot:CAMPEP_0177671544 /NCGR_PEP_ID=MMETSP0447-20121125/24777_1 /TAXON_ID=0 /ORGANISM="Stygamoeba regulata, Strain BSH-02190019" /LENGTH=148 /DNA_ID=CAMNT_0019178977 /DNA_START=47 /DNA_END=490 /DNA_ORIENTATION=+
MDFYSFVVTTLLKRKLRKYLACDPTIVSTEDGVVYIEALTLDDKCFSQMCRESVQVSFSGATARAVSITPSQMPSLLGGGGAPDSFSIHVAALSAVCTLSQDLVPFVPAASSCPVLQKVIAQLFLFLNDEWAGLTSATIDAVELTLCA